jgi:hypothetical protein
LKETFFVWMAGFGALFSTVFMRLPPKYISE